MTKRALLRLMPLVLLALFLKPSAAASENTLPDSRRAALQSAPPSLIFLLAGQSNMVGLGEVALLPRVFQTIPANVVIWDGRDWSPMNVQGDTFGPEIGFAQAIASAFPTERIGIVKYAKGGTAIREWSPNDPQSLYADLMNQYRGAIRKATPKARPVAMLWMQGERTLEKLAPLRPIAGTCRS